MTTDAIGNGLSGQRLTGEGLTGENDPIRAEAFETRGNGTRTLRPGFDSPHENSRFDARPETETGGRGGVRSFAGRLVGGAVGFTGWAFELASLVILLSVLTAIPLLQLIAFGYLLEVSGRLALGATLGSALSHRHEAGRIGLAAIGLWVASLPVQLMAHWESVATVIDPGSRQASLLWSAAVAMAVVAIVYLVWAWARGGRLRHYLWPEPMRFVRESWRWRTWRDVPDRLWAFTSSLRLPGRFWMGARGVAGTLVWLLPAMVIIVANRQGETGLAGVTGGLSLVALGVVLMYLPMLQANFAAENDIRSLFAVRTIRRDFRRAPWAWLFAMGLGLVVFPIPLYLLKIEATPREVMWLPCLALVAMALPARVAFGLVLRRARRLEEPVGVWAAVSRWAARLLMPAVIAVYLTVLTVSQYTSWDGLQTWVRQHAVLIPVPFVGI